MKPRAGYADLWIHIWEELHSLAERDVLVEVELALSMQQEREEVHAALPYAASFHCLVEQWKDCEKLKPKPKEKLIFVDEE